MRAASTANVYVNQVSSVLRNNQLSALRKSKCITISADGTKREAGLQSCVFSYFNQEDEPNVMFWGFLPQSSSTAESITNDIMSVLRSLGGVEESVIGISSDNCCTMTGWKSGVGVRLRLELDKWICHDICEYHCLDTLVRGLISFLGAPVKDVPGAVQWAYLTWYILNSNWRLIKKVVEDKDYGQGSDKKFLKPEQPVMMRWGQMCKMFKFICDWKEALTVAFLAIYNGTGETKPSAALATMLKQWLIWRFSEQIQAHFEVFLEFVTEVWEPYNDQIEWKVPVYGWKSHFASFFRPGRVARLLLKIRS